MRPTFGREYLVEHFLDWMALRPEVVNFAMLTMG